MTYYFIAAIWLLIRFPNWWIRKTSVSLLVKTYQKTTWQGSKKEEKMPFHENFTRKWPNKENSPDNDLERSVYRQKINFYLSFPKKSLRSASRILFRQPEPTAWNMTASLDKVTCTKFAGFGKLQDGFGRFPWYKKYFYYLVVKLIFFMKQDKKRFLTGTNFYKRKARFEPFFETTITTRYCSRNL